MKKRKMISAMLALLMSFDAPYGERIVVNDRKPSGLGMSVAVNIERDEAWELDYSVNNDL